MSRHTGTQLLYVTKNIPHCVLLLWHTGLGAPVLWVRKVIHRLALQAENIGYHYCPGKLKVKRDKYFFKGNGTRPMKLRLSQLPGTRKYSRPRGQGDGR